MQGSGRALLALRCALGKAVGSCCQQRLRGRLKSRSLHSSCRQRISGTGTAGVPAGGRGGAGGTPGLAWLPAADKTAPVPACKASLLGPKQQPSWGKADEQRRGGRHLRKGRGGKSWALAACSPAARGAGEACAGSKEHQAARRRLAADTPHFEAPARPLGRGSLHTSSRC